MASKYRTLRTNERCVTHSLSAGTGLEPPLARSIRVDVSFQHTVPDQGRLHYVLRKLSEKRLKSEPANQKKSRENAAFMLDKISSSSHLHDEGSQENLVATTEKLDCTDRGS